MIDADLEAVPAAIGLIYEAAYDPAGWVPALDAIRRLFHGSAACLGKSGADVTIADVTCVDADPAFHGRYVEEFAADNILWRAAQRMPIGQVYSDPMVIDRRTLERSRIWNEWMMPQDMVFTIGCQLLQSGPSTWLIDIERGAGQSEFDGADVALFGRLAPHLERAVQIGRRFGTAEAMGGAFARLPFGVLLVDSDRRVLEANAAGEAILASAGCGLARRAGRLVAADPAANAMLDRLVAEACRVRHDFVPGRGGDLLVRAARTDDGAADLALSIGPLVGDAQRIGADRCAVVFMRNAAAGLALGFAEQVQALYRLTPKEAGLAAALVAGRSLHEAATEARIRISTARSYLEQIFHKTGVRQQSQLVALLSSLPPPAAGAHG